MANQEIKIPERREDEPPASAQQLQRIRQLTAGQSLQGYRFDYRKLGTDQADTILKQLNAMNDQHPVSNKPSKQGPGCIASLAKGTTALIFWAVVLAGVAGGGYFIYWWMENNPQTTQNSGESSTDDNTAAAPTTPDNPNDNNRNTRASTIFEGLGVSDAPPPPSDPDTDRPDTPTTEPAPRPDPVTPPAPTVDRALAQQLKDLNEMLVSLSQYTRKDFAANLRIQSSLGMQKKLDAFPQALSALEKIDPTLPPRIRAVIDAFAAATFDGPALRDEIKAIRKAIETLQ